MLERKTQKVTVPTIATKRVTVPTAAGLKSKLAGKATSAQSSANARADRAQARADRKVGKLQSRASSRLSTAKAAAVPALAAAGAAVAPKLGEARERVETDVLPRVAETRDQLVGAKDAFVEETLPKIVEAVTTAVAAGPVVTSDAVAKVRDSDTAQRAVAAIKGQPAPQKKKSSGILSGLATTAGILGAAMGLAWFFNKRNAEQDDPWARPLADPYVPPTSGGDTTLAASAGTAPIPTPADAPVVDGPATFAPAVGQVNEIAGDNTHPVPPVDSASADEEIRIIDPLDDHRTGPQEPGRPSF